MKVYIEVEDIGQKRISTRWVCTERLKAGKMEAKARLCARGCEDIEDVPTDSPTCERDNVRLLLSTATSFGWNIHTIDIKSAYLQGETLDRDILLACVVEIIEIIDINGDGDITKEEFVGNAMKSGFMKNILHVFEEDTVEDVRGFRKLIQ